MHFQEESSWVTSVSLLGYITGNVGLGKLLDLLGRKKLLLLSAVPIVFCWIMILFARNAALLIIARFINGIAHVVPTLVNYFKRCFKSLIMFRLSELLEEI